MSIVVFFVAIVLVVAHPNWCFFLFHRSKKNISADVGIIVRPVVCRTIICCIFLLKFETGMWAPVVGSAENACVDVQCSKQFGCVAKL